MLISPLLVLCLALFSFTARANEAALFSLNEEALNEEFSELNVLEANVIADPMFTLEQAASQHLLTDAFAASPSGDGFTGESSTQFEWEGFLWGFCCCPVGLFVVAVNSNKSKSQKTSYWIGVAAYTVLNLISNVAILSANGGMTTTYY